MIQFLPYALAAYGGYRGYRDSKDQGISGINRLLNTAAGAFTGYNLGQVGGFAKGAGFGTTVPSFVNLPGVSTLPGMSKFAPTSYPGMNKSGEAIFASDMNRQRALANATGDDKRGIIDILTRKEGGEYDPIKIAALAGGIPFAMGAFNNQPTDIFMPGYNVNYLNLRDQRPSYTYIDPTTGQEKAYEKVYAPEEAGKDDRQMGPYSMVQKRLKSGGLAEIKKFNEGGINYLPSKMTHDENDSNNYVRATGYVEDGAGVGDKDEDTMLAQLADGEFVTRADGVLGAGIIAGANPSSMKDMREKGAQYFYEQQRRYKRVFDLIKDRNGISKQKTN